MLNMANAKKATGVQADSAIKSEELAMHARERNNSIIKSNTFILLSSGRKKPSVYCRATHTHVPRYMTSERLTCLLLCNKLLFTTRNQFITKFCYKLAGLPGGAP